MPKESLPSNLNPSPNLLGESYTKPNINRKLLNVVKVLAVIPIILYIILITANSYLAKSTNNLQESKQKLESTAYLLKPVEEETRSTMQKIDLYKNYLANRRLVQGKIEGFMDQMPSTIKLKRMSLDDTGLNADVVTYSPIDVSIFIDNYLKDEAVKNIELQSFVYDGFSKTFEGVFEIHFK